MEKTNKLEDKIDDLEKVQPASGQNFLNEVLKEGMECAPIPSTEPDVMPEKEPEIIFGDKPGNEHGKEPGKETKPGKEKKRHAKQPGKS